MFDSRLRLLQETLEKLRKEKEDGLKRQKTLQKDIEGLKEINEELMFTTQTQKSQRNEIERKLKQLNDNLLRAKAQIREYEVAINSADDPNKIRRGGGTTASVIFWRGNCSMTWKATNRRKLLIPAFRD